MSGSGFKLKQSLRRFVPQGLYLRAAAMWRLRGELPWVLKAFRNHGIPGMLFHFGVAPGDDLLCTAMFRELSSRSCNNIWLMSGHPQIFSGNADLAQVVPPDDRFRDYAAIWGVPFQLLEYAKYDRERDISPPPPRHIIAELCFRAGIQGRVELRPYFHLTAAEKEKGVWACGLIAIQSSGLGAKWPMQNKQWFPERFQAVVNGLKSEFKFVQLGSLNDPVLDGVMDLRGKTSIRETAAVLASSRLYIGNAGFLMHLARAVECPAVIIYGGREAPWQTGYACNENLYSAVPCAPCWLWNTCDHGRVCMENISAAAVVHAVRKIAGRTSGPLPEEQVEI